MTPNIIRIAKMEDWASVAAQILQFAKGKKKFVLQGEIGAGKTTLVQAIGTQLGITEQITSPTFSLVNEYPYLEPITGEQKRIYHLDLYRLESIEEAINMGIEDYLGNQDYCFIEWPEVIQPLLSQELIVIKIILEENSTRKILFL